jgi:hypothetical protein
VNRLSRLWVGGKAVIEEEMALFGLGHPSGIDAEIVGVIVETGVVAFASD